MHSHHAPAHKRRRILSACLAGCATLAFSSAAWAQAAYPNRPIRIVVPFSPGGGSDAVARTVAIELAERLGQPVVVENRPGAGGSLGAAEVARAEPNGYTLLLGSTSELVQYPLLSSRPTYDSRKAFAPIGLIGSVPMALIVGKDVPGNSVQDIVAYAKANPGKVNFGSGGTGTMTHLAVELFANATGIKMTHVPYKGSAAVIPDVLNGNLQLAMSLLPGVLPFANDKGLLKIVAVSTDKRSPALVNVPTLRESGVKDYDTALWTCLLAPAGTPADVISKLNRELLAALAKPAVREALARQGADVTPGSPEQLTAKIVAEQRLWGALIKEKGITAE
jgi:tripartite-type tricarboxylate transporter receptor subunit TctC